MDLDVPTSQQRSSIKKTGFGHSTFRVNPGSSAVGLDIHGAQSGTHFNGAIDVSVGGECTSSGDPESSMCVGMSSKEIGV